MNGDIKFNNEVWLRHYRQNKSAVWIKCILSNGEQKFCDHFSGWIEVRDLCKEKGLFVKKMELQFRSNPKQIEIPQDCEAVYFIRSVMGQMGGETRNYYTTGFLKNGVVKKKMWLLPELVIEKETEDDVSECFEEAFIYNVKEKKK